MLAAAAVQLQQWQTRVLTQPVHDALSAIYEEGAVLARYAAASPPVLRESVLANVRALLNAALRTFDTFGWLYFNYRRTKINDVPVKDA